MNCEVCNGYPGCPACSSTPNTVECPDCLGSGHLFFDMDGGQITIDEWEKLPNDEKFEETCETCEGKGYLIDDYEPDYDDFS